MRAIAGRHCGLLCRLRHDTRANTLAIAAAALVPLTALVGGGVDIARAYMTKTRLQAACDAGSLAGRRAMSKSGEYADAERAKANEMFNFNFDGDALDVQSLTYETEDNDDGQVLGTATAILPTLIMKIFGKDQFDLEVACMAELQIGNADVVFVLDTTTSMAGSPIVGLRDAVRDFHRTLNGAVSDSETRIRYGFVPYSMTVNAGGLVASGQMSTDYFVDSATYQTREALFNTVEHVPDEQTTTGPTLQTYNSSLSYNNCTRWGDNRYPNWGSNPSTSGSAPGQVTTTSYSYEDWTQTGYAGPPWNRYPVGICRRTVTETQTSYTTKFSFTRWRYRERDLDTSALKGMGYVAYASDISSAIVDQAGWYDPLTLAGMEGTTASGVGITSTYWNGCVEERNTVDYYDFDPPDSDAYDHDIDLIPDDASTSWKLHLPQFAYYRYDYDSEETNNWRSSQSDYCPAEMKLLQEVELSDDPEEIPAWLETYVTGLTPNGYTYHDIGMLWGAHLTSQRGIFASNVNDTDGKPVSRHIVFMTDGVMQPNLNSYSAYGIESLDNRVAPRFSTTDDVTERHNNRFLAACESAKSQGVTIWVVAFGTDMTDELEACASDGRAYYSADSDELSATFSYIASQVADLRLGA